MDLPLRKVKKLQGSPTIPGDKSLSHRALIFGAMAVGKTEIFKILRGEDVWSTLECLRSLGVHIEETENSIVVHGTGYSNFQEPKSELNCGNSGTTIRLLMGVLAPAAFNTKLVGDQSLSNRPMARVATPLSEMGGKFELMENTYPPITINGNTLDPAEYDLPIASAQVKSAIILAALQTPGESVISGKIQSRDHTERLIQDFDGKLTVSDQEISVVGPQELKACQVTIPGDISSASFWMAAACMVPGSSLSFDNVSLNPTRMGFYHVLARMGAHINSEITNSANEPMGKITVSFSALKGVEILPEEVPDLIDEIPILAVLATQAEGTTKITGAEELRFKESDRIAAVEKNLKAMGVELKTYQDGLEITGPQELKGAQIQTFHDHRIAMAFAIAALVADGETVIKDCETVNISYPGFFKTLGELSCE